MSSNSYTSVCIYFFIGCKRKECAFAHSRDEIKPRICRYDNKCYKNNCIYDHTRDKLDKDELWKREINKILKYNLIELLNKNKDISNHLKYLDKPFAELKYNFKSKQIYRQIPFRNNNIKYVENFPKNIKEIYFSYYFSSWDSAWDLVGKLNNGKYFYYNASCSYTGFDASGRMNLYIEDNLDNLLNYAVSKSVRNIIKFHWNRRLQWKYTEYFWKEDDTIIIV